MSQRAAEHCDGDDERSAELHFRMRKLLDDQDEGDP